ncbi:MAG: hypothetical protein ACLQVD_16425 [Capsulimonadaceae bacterium]
MILITLITFLLIATALTATGRCLAVRLIPQSASMLERNLAGYAIGLVVFAYGMLGIGLAGQLYARVALGWLFVLAAAGMPQMPSMAREAGRLLATCFHPPRLIWLMIGTLAVFFGISLVGCFAPPVSGLRVLQSVYTEYDSIAYHLADPRLYIQAHRIYPIYWEHHSNFAFTGEMWYTFALLANNVPLAKLFHWSCGLAGALAVYRLGARFLGLRAGALAAILFASTPVVFWEAGTAYVDLIGAYFTTLTLLAMAAGAVDKEPPPNPLLDPEREDQERHPTPPSLQPVPSRPTNEFVGCQGEYRTDNLRSGGRAQVTLLDPEREKWWALAAVTMGLTLSSKATAMVTLALLAAGLLYWRLAVRRETPVPAVLRVAAWCAVAILIGCPWYVKSFVYTGNPVYPFYYQIFGGRYWNLGNALVYDRSNASFGLGHQPINLLFAPWNLVMYLMPGHAAALYPYLGRGYIGGLAFNNYPSEYATLSPVLLAAVFAPLLRTRSAPRAIKALALFALASFVFWFVSMQYGRYLIPVLPVLCLLAAWTIDQCLTLRVVTGWALSAFAVVSVGFSLYLGISLARVQWPVVAGSEPVELYLQHGVQAYSAIEYINRLLPPGSKVVFYGNPLGYYCDKPYLWGETGHSAFIPYNKMHSPADLLAFFHSIGVTHVLIYAPQFDPSPQDPVYGNLYALTEGASQPVFSDRTTAIFALPATAP